MKIFNKSEWKKVKLVDVCEIITGNTPLKKEKEYWDKDEVPFITPPELKYEGINYITPNIYVSKIGAKQGRIIPKNSICVCCIGSLGKLGILKEDAITNQQINSLILKNKNVDLLYLYFYLKTIKNNLESIASSTTVKIINKSSFEKIEISLPNLEIQKKISKKLELLENNIDFRKNQLNYLKELNKSLFTKYSKNKKVVNLELEEICEFIKDGTHQTPTYVNTNENGYKFLSSKDVSKGIINWDNTKYISEELHKELYKKIAPKKNDILLAKNGTTGIAALVDKEEIFDIYVSLAILRLKKEYNPKYILEGINSIETNQQFKKSLKGIGVPNLHLKEIKKVKIPIPPIELQNKFAERVEKIEKLKFEIEKSIEEAQKLYNSLISKYFDN
ncbi:Putative type I restriction enzyme specificity protein MPN_638 [Fusobacterium polymorphum]|uniref:restriction endonuclease subunit S n=1 Tax=Fusobacterium nucleatum subsp. polymorphum TaxID=76857 RepID=UPI0005D79102|nr:restriction endonuclease subunit S [Fusobacterium polymorphum]UTI52336.1 restriction endonuclease subunit S [Fusobacterium polymorphum]CKH01887.1 Putative type I restriction enzyme specificity protein MPN_638 [Fusobacterium polymorphum]